MNNEILKRTYTRRDLLRGALTLGGAVSALSIVSCGDETRPLPNIVPTFEPRKENRPGENKKEDQKKTEVEKELSLFGDDEVNSVALEIGITVENFFETTNKINSELKAFKTTKQVSPTHSPAIYEYLQLVYRKAKEHNISPEELMIILDVESAGNPYTKSWIPKNDSDPKKYDKNGNLIPMSAVGISQVLNYTFIDNGVKSEENMFDPETNIEFGVKVFKEFMRASETAYGNRIDGTSAKKFIRAMMGYNGGYKGVFDNFNNLLSETKWYHEKVVRQLMISEIALRMRDKYHYDDATILKKLSVVNSEINIRVEAFRRFRNELVSKREFDYKAYEEAMKDLAKLDISSSDPRLIKAYKEALTDALKRKGESSYMNPSLSMMRALGMEDIYQKSGVNENFKIKDWQNIDTRKTHDPKIVPNNLIIFDQLDLKWQEDESYGNGRAACGPTAIATLLKRFGEETNPAKVDRVFQKRGIRKGPKGGTLIRDTNENSGALLLLKEKGYEIHQLSDESLNKQKRFSFKEAKDYIDQGYLLIASGNADWLGGDSHIFLISDVFPRTETFTISDPYGGRLTRRDLSDLESKRFDYVYAVKPKKIAS